MKKDLCELLVSKHLPQDHASVERDLLVTVSSKGGKDNLLVSRTDVLDGGQASADLAPQEVVEYLDNIFTRFEVETGNVLDETEEEVGGVGLLGELGDQLGYGFCRWPRGFGTEGAAEGEDAPPSP